MLPYLSDKPCNKDPQATDSITNAKFMQDEIEFEHFIPPTDHIASSPPSTTASPDFGLFQPDDSRPSSRKEKSRRTRSSKQSPGSEEDSPENKSQRRREQNRIAQRTFRERKDRYIQNLEAHIKTLDASHKNLQASYKESTDQVSALYTQLIEAQGELDYWRCLAQPPSAGSSPSSAASPMIMHPSTLGPSSTMTPVEANNSIVPTGHAHITVMPGMHHMQHGHFT
ncbi:hypothetical protein UA08_08696 [Talaromyces atroroseus]|uniref:BZIP domain-containing protein n=1 Tax=Talaromyces atroroseus TaxID=1441469 RepID=A0A225ARD7_TALAT|nr:hypothetical protein UA08_08696 [Talaromyces atroroseus]OKL56017.1 hypothetical protein UA08_08696 [Talaromyces atroroseus]